MISLNKNYTTIEVKHGKIKVGDPVLHSGAVVALKVDVEQGTKIAAVSNISSPAVVLCSGDIHDKQLHKSCFF